MLNIMKLCWNICICFLLYVSKMSVLICTHKSGDHFNIDIIQWQPLNRATPYHDLGKLYDVNKTAK